MSDFQLWRTDPGGVWQRPDTGDCQVIEYVLKKHRIKKKNQFLAGRFFLRVGGAAAVDVIYTLFSCRFLITKPLSNMDLIGSAESHSL